MGQGDSARDFDPSKRMKNAGILDVFPIFRTARLGQKIRRSPQSPLCGAAIVFCHALVKVRILRPLGLELLLFVLEHIQLVIPPLPAQQLLVGSLLQNLPVGQEDDLVRVLDGA